MNNRRSKPANTKEIKSELAQERASLSPSRFSERAFENFQRDSEDVVFEADVMATLIPVICGNPDIPNKQKVLFTTLEPITNKGAVKPMPDFFDGALLRDISKDIRDDQALRSTVVPTKHPRVPVAPNLFLEVKGPDGTAGVAHRQACYVGAYGARAMHALQNHGVSEPAYDGNAYAYSSTYNEGLLKLYAHHVTAPATAEGRPEYHMTQLNTYALTGDREGFLQGASAFRNARDLAKRHRDSFIQAVNIRAAQGGAVAAVAAVAAEEAVTETSDEQGDLGDSIECPSPAAWKDAHDALQHQIADGHQDENSDDGEE